MSVLYVLLMLSFVCGDDNNSTLIALEDKLRQMREENEVEDDGGLGVWQVTSIVLGVVICCGLVLLGAFFFNEKYKVFIYNRDTQNQRQIDDKPSVTTAILGEEETSSRVDLRQSSVSLVSNNVRSMTATSDSFVTRARNSQTWSGLELVPVRQSDRYSSSHTSDDQRSLPHLSQIDIHSFMRQ